MSGQTAELLKNISETEQLELAFDIWEKYAQQRITTELTPSQRAELDRRLRAHRENPMLGRSWETLRHELGQ
jgi:putative addiction module component (TIGR02574 family)